MLNLTGSVWATGLTRELASNGPFVILVILAIATLFLLVTFAAERLVETFLLWALFVVPFTAIVPALHPKSQNYPAYYAVALVVFVATTILRRRRPPTIDVGVIFFAYLMCTWLVLAASTPLARTYYPLITPVTELAIYVLVINRPFERTRPILLRGVVALGVVEATIGLSQSVLGRPTFTQVLPTLWTSDRGYVGYLLPGVLTRVTQGSGTFTYFNGLGALLVLSVSVAFGDWLSHRRSIWRLAAFLVIFVGVVTTYSRGSLLGAMAGCAVVWWFSARRNSQQTVVAMVCVLAVAGASISALFVHYYTQTQNFTSRLTTWSYSVSYVLRHPSNIILGTGYSSFGQVILPAVSGQPSGPLLLVHSGPLQVLLELGIVGFALYLMTILVPIARSLDNPRSATRAILIGAIVGFLVAELLDNATFGDPNICGPSGAIMFALVALLRRNVAEADASRVEDGRAGSFSLAKVPDMPRSA